VSRWEQYIAYLHEWAKEHQDVTFEGCSPANYAEWLDNEWLDNEEKQ